ncbi:MAG: hypothetical protein AAGK21_17675, partial [Bacteroidota bacterium]
MPAQPTTRQRRLEAKAYEAARIDTAEGSVRTLLFAQGRTGSTLLESLLASTGHFRQNGEVLRQWRLFVERPVDYVKGLARTPARLSDAGHFVCHVKVYHLTRDRANVGMEPVSPAGFLRALDADGWQVVYLRRADRIRHALSNLVAQERGKYHRFDDAPIDLTLSIQRADLECQVQRRVENEAAERDALTDAGIDFHEVVYERDLLDATAHQQTVDSILDTVGLPRRPVSTEMRKVNDRPVSEIVENFEEFS